MLEEVRKRLGYLVEVGLDYLTLDRLAMTLSGGETQRINLATSLGSSLVGSLYVLDEPTIGLHPRDNDRLIAILEGLRDIGNTVLVVEHDEQMMRRADQIIDIGPGSGALGGEVMFQGTFDEALDEPRSLTGAYLSGRKAIPVPDERRRRRPRARHHSHSARAQHNLKRIDVSFPLDAITVVTGVSGSGKSTLVHVDAATRRSSARRARLRRARSGAHDGLDGRGARSRPSRWWTSRRSAKSPRSNPVTYIKAFDAIRELLASTHQAKIRGYRAGTFSFNVPGGRCETCQGEGVVQVEMQFLADLYLECEACDGKRFKQEVLEVRFKGKNVAEMLDLTVDEAVAFFDGQRPRSRRSSRRSRTSASATSRSASRRTRSRAARRSASSWRRTSSKRHRATRSTSSTSRRRASTSTTSTSCSRPSTQLVEAGHSVILIEHNLDVIKAADWVIDIGPEGGRRGGFVVAEGTPEEVAEGRGPATPARFLRDVLAVKARPACVRRRGLGVGSEPDPAAILCSPPPLLACRPSASPSSRATTTTSRTASRGRSAASSATSRDQGHDVLVFGPTVEEPSTSPGEFVAVPSVAGAGPAGVPR